MYTRHPYITPAATPTGPPCITPPSPSPLPPHPHSTLFGQVAIDALIRRTGRGSVVVIVLAAFFTCACLLACYVAARSVVAFATSADHSIRAPGVC
jgi:hypothetical protein